MSETNDKNRRNKGGKGSEINFDRKKIQLSEEQTKPVEPENPTKINQGAEISPQESEKAVEIPVNPGTTDNSDANGGESTSGGNN